MKKVLILALGVMMVASLASAQEAFIGVYTDNPGWSDCTHVVAAGGLYPAYLVQRGQPGIACSARIANTSALSSLGVTVHTPLSIGNIDDGIEFSYGVCDNDGILLATINYGWFGSPAVVPCTTIEVVDHPQAGGILVADCTLPSPVLYIAQGGLLTVNGDLSCPDKCAWTPPNAVEQSSWGQIKALYTEE